MLRFVLALASGGSVFSAPDRIDSLSVARVVGESADLPSISGSSIVLVWVTPDSAGTLTEFEVKISTVAINARNWNTRTSVTGEPDPEEPGTFQSVVINGLSPNTRYYAAIRTKDTAWSVISNVLVFTTGAPDKRTTLVWTPSLKLFNGVQVQDEDVEYSVYFGTSPDFLDSSYEAGKVTSCRIVGLTYGQTYYYQIKAHRPGSTEYSPPSNTASESR